MPTPSRTEAPSLDRRRNPHIWSWFLKLVEGCLLPSLAVKLLGLLVEWSALLNNCETLDVQSLAGFLDCCSPRAKSSLGMGASLLAHDLASAGLLQSLHCLHGSHRFHRLHCLHSFGHWRKAKWEIQ